MSKSLLLSLEDHGSRKKISAEKQFGVWKGVQLSIDDSKSTMTSVPIRSHNLDIVFYIV